MDLERQRAQLIATINWAQQLRAVLQPILDAHWDRVHFRPSSLGVTMVGLLPHRPQRGLGGFSKLRHLADNFEELFRQPCVEIEHGRVTGEKELQSSLSPEVMLSPKLFDWPAQGPASSSTNVIFEGLHGDSVASPMVPSGRG
jgi:hypothetical protein